LFSFAQNDTTSTGEDLFDVDFNQLLNMEVTTASKKSQSISEAPAIITVITEDQIKEYGVNSLSELMSYVPGFTVQDAYWKRNIITARGIKQTLYNDKILVLLNGVPTYDAMAMEHYLDFIPIASVKRIEIIRGPGSTLYGTNAFAAVINIITKDADNNPGLYAYQKYGSFNTTETGINFAQKFGKISVNLGGTYTNRDGYTKKNVVDNKGDTSDIKYKFRNANIFANITYSDEKVGSISLQTGAMTQIWTKFGPTPTHIFGVNGDLENGGLTHYKKFYANLIWEKHFSDKFSTKFITHYNNADNFVEVGQFGWRLFSTAGALQLIDSTEMNPNRSFIRFSGNIFQEELQVNYSASKMFNLIGGVVSERRITTHLSDVYGYYYGTPLYGGSTLDDGRVKHPIEINDMGGYVQADGKFDFGLGYVAGIRLTRLGIDGNTYITPRGGLVYNINDNISVKALYGQAFRSPGPHEQYYKVPRVVYGPDIIGKSLKPEKISTTELAADIAIASKYKLRINGFMNTIEDIISRRGTSPEDTIINPEVANALIYDNLGKQHISGGEIEIIGYPSDFLSFWANASYKTGTFDTKNAAGQDTTLSFIPYMEHITANAGIAVKPIKNINISPNIQYVGERTGYLKVDKYYQHPIKIAPYMLLNMRIAYRISDNVSIELSARNLLDKNYVYPEEVRREAQGSNVDANGNPIPVVIPGGPGRAFYGTIRVNF